MVKRNIERSKQLANFSQEEQAILWGNLSQHRQRAIVNSGEKAVAVLTPRQKLRLGQIAFQLRLEAVFYESDVVQGLRLTKSQRDAIRDARNSFRRAAQALKAASDSRQHYEAELLQLRRKQVGQYLSLLSANQLALHAAFCGPPIPFTKAQIAWELRPR